MADMKKWVWGATTFWIAVVAAGSALAWFAIDGAGRQVTPAEPLTSTTPRPTATTALPSTSPAPTAPGAPRLGTWNGRAGTVTVGCSGRRGRLVAATPADGWRVEREDSASQVRVVFERSETEVRVRADCSAQGPGFHVETKGEGGEGND